MSKYPVLVEGIHANESLVSEANGHRSREAIIVAAGANLVPCTVLGKVGVGSAASAAKAGGNTGNGTLTMDGASPIQSGAKTGVYQVRLIATAANAGTFRVTDPDGFVLGDVAVGATFANDVKFATADGATDFVVGDGFDITVSAGTGKYKQLNTSAVDGSQVAVAVLYGKALAASADVDAVAYVRDCEHNGGELVWPVGISTNAKAAAIAQLAAVGIIVR